MLNRLPWLLALLPAVIWFRTLAPGIMHTDWGELVCVQTEPGIAHPTGYPLFTLIGYLYQLLPLGADLAFQMNLLALFYMVAATVIFGKFFVEWTNRFQGKEWGSDRWMGYAALAAAVWSLAFSRTFWQQSSSIEVYSLQAALLGLIFLAALRYWNDPEKGWKPALFLGIAIGLGLANHLTTFTLGPGMLWLILRKEGLNKQALRQAALTGGAALGVAFLLYFSLYLRAGGDPGFNWGGNEDWTTFWYHISAGQFRVFMFESSEVAGANLSAFLGGLPAEFAYIWLIPALWGLFALFSRHRDLAIFSFLIFAGNVLWVINYHIVDLEPYYLPALMMVAVWIGYGTGMLLSKVMPRMRIAAAAVPAAALLGLILNFSPCDMSDRELYDLYARDALESLPEDALLITSQWPVLNSAAWYLQHVEGKRPDVDIVDYTLLRDRFWYSGFMKRKRPRLYATTGMQADHFSTTLKRYTLYDPSAKMQLGSAFISVMRAILSEAQNRPVLLGPEMMFKMKGHGWSPPQGYVLVPYRYFVWMLPTQVTQQYIPEPGEMPEFPFSTHDEPEQQLIRENVSRAMLNRAAYELSFGRKDRARSLVQRARATWDQLPVPPALLSL